MKKLIALLFILPLFALAQTRPGVKVNTPQDFKKMVSMEGHFALVDTCLWWIYNSGADSAKLGFRNDSLILLNADGSIPPTNFGGGGGGSGTVTNIATSNGITGGPITTTGTISGVNAAADGSTKGVAAFTATDFNSSSGVISIDFTNAQKATGSQPGLLTSTDWTTFNNKGTVTSIATSNGLTGGTITGTGTISGVNAVADGSTKGVSSYTATDFNSATGVISIDYTNMQKASGSQPGGLSSSDWTIFNNKASVAGPDGSFQLRNGSALKGTDYLYYDSTSWGGGKGFMQVKGNFTVVDSSDNQQAFAVYTMGQKPIIYMGDQDGLGNQTYFELNDVTQKIEMHVPTKSRYIQNVNGIFLSGNPLDSNYVLLTSDDEGIFGVRLSGGASNGILSLSMFSEDGLILEHGGVRMIESYKTHTDFNGDSIKVLPLAGAGTRMVTATATGKLGAATIPTGTVTNFSAGNLSPLFTTSEATTTTTPALSFALSSAAARTVFGRGSGSGAPSFVTIDTNWFTNFYLMCRASFQAGYGLNFVSGKYSVDTTRNGTNPASQWLMKHYADSIKTTISAGDAYLANNQTFTGNNIFTYSTGITIGNIGGSDGVVNLIASATGSIVAIRANGSTPSNYDFNLPTTSGNAGQVLTSQGGASPMTWTNPNPVMFVSKTFDVNYPDYKEAFIQNPGGASTATITANTATTGETYNVHAEGYWKNYTGGPIGITLELGSYGGIASVSFVPIKSTSDEYFELEFFITVDDNSVSGSVVGGGKFEYNWNNFTAEQIPSLYATNVTGIDFTVDQRLALNIDMSSQISGHMHFQRLTIERLSK